MGSNHKPKGDSDQLQREPIRPMDPQTAEILRNLKDTYRHIKRENNIPERGSNFPQRDIHRSLFDEITSEQSSSSERRR